MSDEVFTFTPSAEPTKSPEDRAAAGEAIRQQHQTAAAPAAAAEAPPEPRILKASEVSAWLRAKSKQFSRMADAVDETFKKIGENPP